MKKSRSGSRRCVRRMKKKEPERFLLPGMISDFYLTGEGRKVSGSMVRRDSSGKKKEKVCALLDGQRTENKASRNNKNRVLECFSAFLRKRGRKKKASSNNNGKNEGKREQPADYQVGGPAVGDCPVFRSTEGEMQRLVGGGEAGKGEKGLEKSQWVRGPSLSVFGRTATKVRAV